MTAEGRRISFHCSDLFRHVFRYITVSPCTFLFGSFQQEHLYYKYSAVSSASALKTEGEKGTRKGNQYPISKRLCQASLIHGAKISVPLMLRKILLNGASRRFTLATNDQAFKPFRLNPWKKNGFYFKSYSVYLVVIQSCTMTASTVNKIPEHLTLLADSRFSLRCSYFYRKCFTYD